MMAGYAGVRCQGQNPDHQIDALARSGVARADIHVDHASGAKATRPQLDLILRVLRDGDVLVLTRLDRLGRSVLRLVSVGAQLRERGVGLKVHEQGIDTDTAEGRAMVGMLSVLAELQRELIVARSTVYGHLDKATVGARPHAQTTSPPPPGVSPPASRTGRACPSCGHDPTTREDAAAQRADLAVTWLCADPNRAGQILTRRCQPHSPVVDVACVVCGDGPILAGALATAGTDADTPEPVRRWLGADGWQLTPQLVCPDHRTGRTSVAVR